jgi:t-SNARE complex subunit (syntaxin)
MDLAMVKQEQGETLRKYMQRFFEKRATVVDVTDKEVIDLFQDVSTTVAPSKTSVVAARAPSPTSRT